MTREFTAILERNRDWFDGSVSEPYEAGWAREAVLFSRSLVEGDGGPVIGHVQMSPDGLHWADAGTSIEIPAEPPNVEFLRLSHFGNWLRLRIAAPQGARRRVLVTLHLKE